MGVAMKCTLFDATNHTVVHFCTGRGSRASYAAVLTMATCIALSLVGVALVYAAGSSNEPRLLAADLILQGPYIATYPFLLFWGLALYNMGGTIGHLFNVNRAEAQLLERRAAREGRGKGWVEEAGQG